MGDQIPSLASIALRNPAKWNRADPLSYEQFHYSFANAACKKQKRNKCVTEIVKLMQSMLRIVVRFRDWVALFRDRISRFP